MTTPSHTGLYKSASILLINQLVDYEYPLAVTTLLLCSIQLHHYQV